MNLSGETTEKASRRAAAQRRSPSRRAGAASVYRLFTNSRRVCVILTLRHPFRAKQGLDAKASIFPFWYQTWVFAGIPAIDFREARLRLPQLLNNSRNGTKTAFFSVAFRHEKNVTKSTKKGGIVIRPLHKALLQNVFLILYTVIFGVVSKGYFTPFRFLHFVTKPLYHNFSVL